MEEGRGGRHLQLLAIPGWAGWEKPGGRGWFSKGWVPWVGRKRGDEVVLAVPREPSAGDDGRELFPP